MAINNYIKSLHGEPPEEHNAIKTFLLIIGAVFSGYTASQFPPEFLSLFATPFGQFIIFMILGLGYYSYKNLEFIIYDSILYVIMLQILLFISKEIYKNENGNKNGNRNGNENRNENENSIEKNNLNIQK